MASFLAKDDAAVQRAVAALDQHVGTMTNSYNTASRIKDEIRAGYVASSSTAFQTQVENWLAKCAAVRNMFQTLGEDLHGASNVISQSDEQALGMSHSFASASDSTYAALMGQ
jgi:uncharacterized protein YukE